VRIAEAALWYPVFLFSVTLHEFAHAWAAERGGDPTAYLGGQGSLNPLPHIRREPVGMVIFPIASVLLFGWPLGYASAPYDPHWAHRHPRRAAWMALAGPGSNFLLFLGSVALIKLGIGLRFFAVPHTVTMTQVTTASAPGLFTALAYFLSMLFTLNLVLTIFNLLPLPPFDGSEIVALFVGEDTARRYHAFIKNPLFGLIGFLVAWRVFSPIFRVVFLAAINVVYPGSHFS